MLSVMGSQINILALASGTADYNIQNSKLNIAHRAIPPPSPH